MKTYSAIACLLAGTGLAFACEQRSSIENETRELSEAQNSTGNVAKDLELRLQEAKAEVVELEKKLALAREGVTDDVVQQRAELQKALEQQRGQVHEQINQAKQEAQVLDKETSRAIQQLEKTPASAHVDAKVKTETEVTRSAQQPLEAPARNELIPVRGGPERAQQPAEAATDVKSTTSTTTSPRTTVPAPTPNAAPAPVEPSPRPNDVAPAPPAAGQ